MLERLDFRVSGQMQTLTGRNTKPRTQTKESFASLVEKKSGESAPGEETLADISFSGIGAVSPKTLVLHARTSSGQESTLYWGEGILASVGGKGGSVNVKYHESSTAEVPVVQIWGKTQGGENYEAVVSLNEVDPHHASPAEMIALNAHLSRGGDLKAAKAGPIALWASMEDAFPDTKMDFESYYGEYIAMQAAGGNRSGAHLYQLQLEEFLFANRQGAEKMSKVF